MYWVRHAILPATNVGELSLTADKQAGMLDLPTTNAEICRKGYTWLNVKVIWFLWWSGSAYESTIRQRILYKI